MRLRGGWFAGVCWGVWFSLTQATASPLRGGAPSGAGGSSPPWYGEVCVWGEVGSRSRCRAKALRSAGAVRTGPGGSSPPGRRVPPCLPCRLAALPPCRLAAVRFAGGEKLVLRSSAWPVGQRPGVAKAHHPCALSSSSHCRTARTGLAASGPAVDGEIIPAEGNFDRRQLDKKAGFPAPACTGACPSAPAPRPATAD